MFFPPPILKNRGRLVYLSPGVYMLPCCWTLDVHIYERGLAAFVFTWRWPSWVCEQGAFCCACKLVPGYFVNMKEEGITSPVFFCSSQACAFIFFYFLIHLWRCFKVMFPFGLLVFRKIWILCLHLDDKLWDLKAVDINTRLRKLRIWMDSRI